FAGGIGPAVRGRGAEDSVVVLAPGHGRVLAEHLTGAGDHDLGVDLADHLEHVEGSGEVDVDDFHRPRKVLIDADDRGEMEYDVYLVGDGTPQRVGVQDVALEVPGVLTGEFLMRRRRRPVEDGHIVAPGDQLLHKVTADEAAAAGDHDAGHAHRPTPR